MRKDRACPYSNTPMMPGMYPMMPGMYPMPSFDTQTSSTSNLEERLNNSNKLIEKYMPDYKDRISVLKGAK